MGKNNNTKEMAQNLSCLIGVSVIIVIILVVILAFKILLISIPIIFLIGLFVNYLSWRNTDKILANRKFWLTSDEKEEFKSLAITLSRALDKKENAIDRANAEGIRWNKGNGRLNAKSYLGQDLQGVIDESDTIVNKYMPTYNNWTMRPIKLYKRARGHYAKSIGIASALVVGITYFLSTADNIAHNVTQYVNSIGGTVETGGELLKETWSPDKDNKQKEEQIKSTKKNDKNSNIKNDDSKDKDDQQHENIARKEIAKFTTVLIFNAILMLSCYFVAWIIGRIVFSIKYRKPPVLDLKNVDTYA